MGFEGESFKLETGVGVCVGGGGATVLNVMKRFLTQYLSSTFDIWPPGLKNLECSLLHWMLEVASSTLPPTPAALTLPLVSLPAVQAAAVAALFRKGRHGGWASGEVG